MFPAILGFLGNTVGAFFGFKNQQAKVVESALDSLDAIQTSDAQYASAAAKSIAALYESGPPIERLWRPVAMWVFLSLIVARWFGYVPEHLNAAEIDHVYTWFEIGLIGYMPLRSLDKYVKGFQIGKILNTFVAKKLG